MTKATYLHVFESAKGTLHFGMMKKTLLMKQSTEDLYGHIVQESKKTKKSKESKTSKMSKMSMKSKMSYTSKKSLTVVLGSVVRWIHQMISIVQTLAFHNCYIFSLG